MFYKSLPCGKKVQFFATKSAIFFNQLFFMFLFFRSCGKKKCNLIALLLHFYCTLRVLNFSFCFIVLSVFFQPCCTCCTFPNTPHDFWATSRRVCVRARMLRGAVCSAKSSAFFLPYLYPTVFMTINHKYSIPPPPPIPENPTLIGWVFFCPLRQCWRSSGCWPL